MISPSKFFPPFVLAISLLLTGCGSNASRSTQANQSPAPVLSPDTGAAGAPNTDAAAIAEDSRRGRCDRQEYDYDGLFTTVRACARGDLDAGYCDWHGAVDGLAKCELQAGDEDNVGAFARELAIASDGKTNGIDDVRGRTVRVNVYFANLAEWRRWQERHQEETLTRGLATWARVYHRNHSVNANACVEIINKAFVGNAMDAWNAYEDGSEMVVAERCEGE